LGHSPCSGAAFRIYSEIPRRFVGDTYIMSLDQATVARIAHLARIRVAPDQAEALQEEMQNILAFVEQHGEVDTDDVPPMTSVTPQALRWREDKVTDGDKADKVLGNAPEQASGFYAVPRVVE